ncbi:13526_t:CDS:2 [Ambispora leptoticha]|uniref:13526_t:CDS:1 n=1 Tax=Ambispora leptoticha TaxID=144679 RepID=A0A9N9F091_9GLOM|nr:13526_t:CDS:2 [Ambispora leptoticha]
MAKKFHIGPKRIYEIWDNKERLQQAVISSQPVSKENSQTDKTEQHLEAVPEVPNLTEKSTMMNALKNFVISVMFSVKILKVDNEVGTKDNPLYEAEFGSSSKGGGDAIVKKDEHRHLNQFIVHSALDIVEEMQWNTNTM